jgi:hypothetical protein
MFIDLFNGFDDFIGTTVLIMGSFHGWKGIFPRKQPFAA